MYRALTTMLMRHVSVIGVCPMSECSPVPVYTQVGWTVAGKFPQERLKLEIQHSGIDRETTGCDVDLPAGRLFFSITTLGNALSQKGGGLSIEQFRFFVRRERRIVGVFKADRIAPRRSAPP